MLVIERMNMIAILFPFVEVRGDLGNMLLMIPKRLIVILTIALLAGIEA
jgi:hypothetical protein